MYRAIAAGIGGAGSWQALAWAAEQAETAGNRLVMIHVCAPGSPLDRIPADPSPAEVELIDPSLARALLNNRARLGLRRVALKIRSGDPDIRLVDVSAGVRLLVIGAGEGGRTVRRILRHAHCPVVVVRRAAPVAGRVVVGVDGSEIGQAALEFAFAHAAAHGFTLTALHASESDERDLVNAEIEPWVRKFPGVAVAVATPRGSVADELIRAGADARLVVVGDKRRGVIARARTGDVPVTVAMEAPCPVVVVPVDQFEGAPL